MGPKNRTKEARDAQREKMIKMREQGHTYMSIAHAIGCSHGNVRSVLCRAFEKPEKLQIKNDIVYKLRTCRDPFKRIKLCQEAADEIELLREKLNA